jgi:enterochelin esterase family protein
MKTPALLLALAISFAPLSASAQVPIGAFQDTPHTTANPDHTITFRLSAPAAHQVTVSTDALLAPLTLTKDASGIWSATTPTLPPELYGYTFTVDGIKILDPLNAATHPNFLDLYSDILLPASPASPWELTDIPHGDVATHAYSTHIGLHYPGDQTAYVVYTPPNYDPHRKSGYPVLYLLHGFTDTEHGWTLTGKANLMLDRLIADHKMVPSIVVMPRGYGDLDIVLKGRNSGVSMDGQNVDLFARMLTEEVIPQVDRTYNVARGRENRAIAGLSMGGLESVSIGLQHPDLFAWVIGMSSALGTQGYDTRFPVDPAKAKLHLLWIGCGTDDHLITANRAFSTWAKQKGLPVTEVEIPGAHTFVVWRQNLLDFAPLLFRP